MKKYLIIFFALLLCACAQKTMPPEPGEQDRAAQIWEKMQSAGEESPYRIQFSLRFGEEGDTRRVTGLLWGNDARDLRMDIMAGVGALIAKIRDDENHFSLYSTQDNKLYFHDGSNKPLLKIGMPLPFSISQLANLLNGNYGAVFGKNYKEGNFNNNMAIYKLDTPPGGTLRVNGNALPEEWKQGGDGWILRIATGEDNLPKSLRLSNGEGKKAIILVKEREKSAPFDTGQMDLKVPSSAGRLPLAKYRIKQTQ